MFFRFEMSWDFTSSHDSFSSTFLYFLNNREGWLLVCAYSQLIGSYRISGKVIYLYCIHVIGNAHCIDNGVFLFILWFTKQLYFSSENISTIRIHGWKVLFNHLNPFGQCVFKKVSQKRLRMCKVLSDFLRKVYVSIKY